MNEIRFNFLLTPNSLCAFFIHQFTFFKFNHMCILFFDVVTCIILTFSKLAREKNEINYVMNIFTA